MNSRLLNTTPPNVQRAHKIGASLLVLSAVGLLVCLALYAPRAGAEEGSATVGGAACAQYDCSGAACDQYDCDQVDGEGAEPEPPSPTSDPVHAPASDSASAPSSAPSPGRDQYEDDSVPEGGGPVQPLDESTGASASASASASAGAFADASASAPAATDGQDGGPANAQDPAPKPAPGASEGEEGAEEPDPQAVRPIKGYPYQSEPCESRHCGMERVSGQVECAVYETASGKEVYGCANLKAYERKGCYEITFYTQEGKPYSNLDTCSGEDPYAPPEPLKDNFYYWDPPPRPSYHEKGFSYSCTTFYDTPNRDCGIRRLSGAYSCEAFFDTRFGTVRGCYKGEERFDNLWWKEDCSPVRAYDESGRYLGTFRDCTIEKEMCGENNCGTGLDRSQGWECQKATKRWGSLYGPPEREGWILCLNFDRHDEFEANPTEETMYATCGKVVYPDGRVEKRTCGHQGGPDIFASAWKPAQGADDALNGEDEDARDGEDGSQGPATLDGPDVAPNPGGGEPPAVGAPAGAGNDGPETASSSGPDRGGSGSPTPVARAAVGARETAVSLALSAPGVLADVARYVRSTAESAAEVVGTGSANAGVSGERHVPARTAAEEGSGAPPSPASERDRAGSGGPDVSESSNPTPGREEGEDVANNSEPAGPMPDQGQPARIAGTTSAAGWSGIALPLAGLCTAGALYAARRRHIR